MLKNLTNYYIDGQWVKPYSQKTSSVMNPATEKSVGEVILANQQDVQRAIDAAKNAFVGFSHSTVDERIQILENILSGMNSRYEDLANAMTIEMGTPYTFSRQQQVASGVEHCEVMIEALKQFEFSQSVQNAKISLEPIGVCGLITPWNWPLNQIACKVFAAIAAGCTMILKPSEISPISAIVLAEIIDQCDLPKGVFNLIIGRGEVVGSYLSKSPDIHMMSITGSTRAGIAVAQESANTVKRVHQELGGNCPNIVLPDADLPSAISVGLQSVFSNSGQTCDSPARILVHRSQIDEVRAMAIKTAEAIVVGDVDNSETEMGPLASEQHFNKVQSLIELGIQEGELLVGGLGRPKHLSVGYFCQPTVILVEHSSTIAKTEIFGPVALIVPYDDEQQAIEMANDTEYGLAGYIQTKDAAKAQKIAKLLRCGTVQINYPEYNLRVPFGGFKQSGNGREYAQFGLKDFLEYKSIIG